MQGRNTLRLQAEWLRRQALRTPATFRQAVRSRANTQRRMADEAAGFQRRDYAALDGLFVRALRGESTLARRASEGFSDPRESTPSLARRASVGKYAWLERPRGHSKTTDAALYAAWALAASDRPLEGLVAACDQEQAGLVLRAIDRLKRANQVVLCDLESRTNAWINVRTGARLRALAADVASSWGELPDFVLCDEVAHWQKREFWESLFSSAAKVPTCALAVLTNAGYIGTWAWDVREHARTTPETWHFSRVDGPSAPWIRDADLAEQRTILPPVSYRRLWLNEWVAGAGEFLSAAEAEACLDEDLCERDQAEPGVSYVAAVDYAEKHDFTVGCIGHREGDCVVIDRMDVVVPTPESPTPVNWVKRWLLNMSPRFNSPHVVIDEYQLLGLVQELEGVLDIQRFNFAGGKGNHLLAQSLRRHVVERRLRIPAGCGDVKLPNGDDSTLLGELASLQVRELPNGRFRFDHISDGIHHDDRAYALAVVCHTLETGGDAAMVLDVSVPPVAGEIWWPVG